MLNKTFCIVLNQCVYQLDRKLIINNMQKSISRSRVALLHEALDRELQSLNQMNPLLLSQNTSKSYALCSSRPNIPAAARANKPNNSTLSSSFLESREIFTIQTSKSRKQLQTNNINSPQSVLSTGSAQIDELAQRLAFLESKMREFKLPQYDSSGRDLQQEDGVSQHKGDQQRKTVARNQQKEENQVKFENFELKKVVGGAKSSKVLLVSKSQQNLNFDNPIFQKKDKQQCNEKQIQSKAQQKPTKNINMSIFVKQSPKTNEKLKHVKAKTDHNCRNTKDLSNQFQAQTANARIRQLQEQMRKSRLQNKKLMARIKTLESVERDFRVLKANYQKSEQIRRQQKMLLQNYKLKLTKD